MTGALLQHLPVAAILLVALGLRSWGLSFGLPHDHCRPDEVTLVHHALSIGAGDLNPHFFNYPSLHLYLLAVVFGAYFALGYGTGSFSGLQDFELSFYLDPSYFYLIGRALGALLGTTSVWLVYRIGVLLDDARAGRMAALFLAVSFLHVRDSHFATTDVPATCYFLASCALALHHVKTRDSRTLYLSGVLLGLAASTKYNLAICAVTPLLAAWSGPAPQALRRAATAAFWMAAAFFLGSPYILLDFTAFWRDLTYERAHFYTGHGLDLDLGWLYHLYKTLPHGMGWPLFVAGLAGALRWGSGMRRTELALLSCLLCYFAVAGSGKSVFYRYAIPLLPLLCLAAGTLVSRLVHPPIQAWAGALLIAAPTAWASANHNALLARHDTRLLAARWIEENVPAGAKIARCCASSLYGHPQLHLSLGAARQRMAELSAAGYSYRRWRHLEDLAARSPRPGYHIVELVKDGPSAYSWTWSRYDLDRLRREGVEWVLFQEHPYLGYSLPDRVLASELRGSEVATFDPFRRARPPVYDPIDAFYLPVSGFNAVTHAGPQITIYRLPGRLPAVAGEPQAHLDSAWSRP